MKTLEKESHLDQVPRFEDFEQIVLDLVGAITDFPPVGFILGTINMAHEEVKAAVDKIVI